MEQALYDAYGQALIANIYSPTDTYYVILELLPKYQFDPNSLGMLYLHASNGKMVPLNAVTKMRTEIGPLAVAHLGQFPAVTISFNLLPGVSLGDAVDRVGDLAHEIAARYLPDLVPGDGGGVTRSSLGGMGVLLAMAILVIYMVLGILYESFIHPITILSGLPSAGLAPWSRC